MATTLIAPVPQGFEPDIVPDGFEPNSVPQGFEPDPPSFTQSLTSDLSSGQPERISRAGQAIAGAGMGMLNIGLSSAANARQRQSETEASLEPVATGNETFAPKPVAPPAPPTESVVPTLREAVQYATFPFVPLEGAGEFATKLGQDIVSKLTGDTRYGGNLRAWVENPEQQSPAEKFISQSARDAPTTAFFANLGKQVSEMSPMLGMGAAPGVAGRLVSGGFAGTMGLSFYDTAIELEHELAKPKEQQDAGKIAELKASVVSSGLFGALATVHSAAPRRAAAAPVPERPETLEAQLKLVQDGTKPAMLVTPGEVAPAVPEGFQVLPAGARGKIIFNPRVVSPEQAKRLLNQGEEGLRLLLGFGATKEQAAATGPTAVLETKVGDTPVQQEAVSPTTLPTAVDASKRTAPGGEIELKPTDQVIAERTTPKETLTSETTTATGQPAKPPVVGETAPSPPVSERSIAADWTSATEEAPPRTETPRRGTTESGPEIMELGAGIPLPKFANRKMSSLDSVTTQHSGKIQKSMSEARRAQKEIKHDVPSERRQNAISIWREANGDIPTLQSWASAARGKAFKRAATDAQTLTPKEIAIARKAGAAFDVLERRGNRFDVLKSHRDNYVPHVWDVKRPGSGFGTGMLKQRFRFSKARTFNTFFEGDQAGFKPKTLAIGKLLPVYIHEMNTVIADRQFVRDAVTGTAKDGSPLVVPRGNVKSVDGPQGQAVLVQPRALRDADTSDYRVMQDQPALSNWTWEGKDTDGKPVFVKADLALHPEAYRRVNAMLGQSAIRQWYRDQIGGTAQIPRALARGLDTAQAAMKREMFGLLAPFHQVQEGTHAIGHLVNPFFGVPKIDLSRNPAQLDAANHGLMLLPDRSSSSTYMEGVGTKASLLSRGIRKVPKAGEAIADVIDGYQDYLFHQYIPGLKFKTYEAMVKRNTKLYGPELASGEMTMADVKITSAEQANAAYGHLNYALLDRNPTIQHFIQLAALAPDFLEARVRFAGQGVKGLSSKVGHEQFKAIAILAAAQAGTAVILSSLLGVPYDPHHPFEVVYKGRRYAMRSVPEDIFALFKDTRQFAYSRVNPLTVRGGVQLATGLNYRGEKTTPLETMGELLAGYIPITARSLPGIRSLTETGRNSPISPLEQLSGSLGLRVSRYSPISETYRLAGEWMDKQKIDRDKGSYPVSKYQQLRYALEDGDMERAAQEYAELRKTMPPGQIASGFAGSVNHPFTKNRVSDDKFSKSLTGYDKEIYNLAVKKRQDILNRFTRMPKK